VNRARLNLVFGQRFERFSQCGTIRDLGHRRTSSEWIRFPSCSHSTFDRPVYILGTREEPFFWIIDLVAVLEDGKLPFGQVASVFQAADRAEPAILDAIQVQIAALVARDIVTVRVFDDRRVEPADDFVGLLLDVIWDSFPVCVGCALAFHGNTSVRM